MHENREAHVESDAEVAADADVIDGIGFSSDVRPFAREVVVPTPTVEAAVAADDAEVGDDAEAGDGSVTSVCDGWDLGSADVLGWLARGNFGAFDGLTPCGFEGTADEVAFHEASCAKSMLVRVLERMFGSVTCLLYTSDAADE